MAKGWEIGTAMNRGQFGPALSLSTPDSSAVLSACDTFGSTACRYLCYWEVLTSSLSLVRALTDSTTGALSVVTVSQCLDARASACV